ncbi:MAG: ATP synthase subunit I [Lachnospiraceae bacterium]|nr:ATP synthase subunit I [Lachnospiraceae bacterium]
MQETKHTLYELITGIIICFLLFLFGNIFVSNRIAYTLGLLIGCLIAGVMSGHMYRALLQAMLYDEETAAKKVQKGTILRLLLMMAGLVAALLLPQWISIIGVALGVLSLKFSAYLQPLTHKVLKNFINKGR